MPSVGGLCAACKRPVADHLHSRRRPPAEISGTEVAVVDGRCVWAESQAAQKLCWVAIADPMTPEEYRKRLAEGKIPLEPCPMCGGKLAAHGRFSRTIAGQDGQADTIELLRGRCRNPECPVCTVTHYPCFLTPYHVVPTAEREATVRARAEGASWPTLAAQVPVTTVRRWCQEIAARADEVLIGLTAVWHRLDVQAPVLSRLAETPVQKLRAMFGVCDAVGRLLAQSEGWKVAVPALAIPRLFRPSAPTTLPVWT